MPIVAIGLNDQSVCREHEVGLPPSKHGHMHLKEEFGGDKGIMQRLFNGGHPGGELLSHPRGSNLGPELRSILVILYRLPQLATPLRGPDRRTRLDGGDHLRPGGWLLPEELGSACSSAKDMGFDAAWRLGERLAALFAGDLDSHALEAKPAAACPRTEPLAASCAIDEKASPAPDARLPATPLAYLSVGSLGLKVLSTQRAWFSLIHRLLCNVMLGRRKTVSHKSAQKKQSSLHFGCESYHKAAWSNGSRRRKTCSRRPRRRDVAG